MNQAIAEIIKEYVETLSFVDKIAGLVSTQSMTITGEDGVKVIKRYPVACCTTADDCKAGAYNDLTPNSQYKSVIYFEDGGLSFERYAGNFKYYKSNLRLVAWLNVQKILEEDCESSQCTYSSHAIADIIRILPEFPQNIDPFTRVYIEVTGQVIRDNSIFSKYTYNELQTQYLLSPYDYFALEITTTFGICLPGTSVYEPCDTIGVSVTDCVNGLTDDSGDIIIE